MAKIVKCPACRKDAVLTLQGKAQCCHCGHGCKTLNLGVQATIPKGKIKTVPLPKQGNKSLFQTQVKIDQTELF